MTDTKQTAVAIRSALRQAFPGVKFSVRMATGTGHGWISVCWTDGPTSAQVDQVTQAYESSRWSGMDERYVTTSNSQWSCCGVTHGRRISPEWRSEMAARIERDPATGQPFVRLGPGRRIWDNLPCFDAEYFAERVCQQVEAAA